MEPLLYHQCRTIRPETPTLCAAIARNGELSCAGSWLASTPSLQPGPLRNQHAIDLLRPGQLEAFAHDAAGASGVFTQTLDCKTCVDTADSGRAAAFRQDHHRRGELILDVDKATAWRRSRATWRLRIRSRPDLPASVGRFPHQISHARRLRVHLLVQGVLLAGGGSRNCPDHERLAAVNRPVTMQVFTTPT